MQLEADLASRLVDVISASIVREYPNKIAHVLAGDADARPPRALTPVFYGSFDWHSAVHGHWALVRLLRQPYADGYHEQAFAALEQNIRPAGVEGELRYLTGEGRAAFEMPYGMAWLLQLAAELREFDHPRGRRLGDILAPLEDLARRRFGAWLRRLSHPIRSGEHSQSAFAMGLVIDWARAAGDAELEQTVAARAVELYGPDVDGPAGYEPSAYDFLSPCLAEADLMRRVLDPGALARWLQGFLPALGSRPLFAPVTPVDRRDGKLVHFDGLNLSRAWMMRSVADALPSNDERASSLRAMASEHAAAGMTWLSDATYAGTHWLGSFAVYLATA